MNENNVQEESQTQYEGAYCKVEEDPHVSSRDSEVQDALSSWKLRREVVFAIALALIVFTSGGLILGFGPVYTLLVDERQWQNKCDPSTRTNDGSTCPEQEVYLQYVFSTSFLCLSAANAFFGIFLDMMGPRITTIVGLSIAVIGNFMLAYGDSASGSGISIIAGYSMIGAGGFAAYLATFQLAQLFEKQEIYCSILSGVFNASGYVYMLLMIGGLTRASFFTGYGFFVVAAMVICFILYPLRAVSKSRTHLTLSGFSCRLPEIQKPTGLFQGLKSQLRRKDLWFFAIFFAWISMIFGFAGGALPNIIYKAAKGNDSTADLYVNFLYPIIVNGTFIYTPIVGYVLERFGFRVVFFATLVLVHAFIGTLLIPSLHVQVLSLVLYSMGQAAFYALQFTYIMMCFPGELYGSLQSMLAICSFLMGLLNYLFTPWAQTSLNGNYTPVLLIMAGPLVVFYFCLGLIQNKGQSIEQEESTKTQDGFEDKC